MKDIILLCPAKPLLKDTHEPCFGYQWRMQTLRILEVHLSVEAANLSYQPFLKILTLPFFMLQEGFS